MLDVLLDALFDSLKVLLIAFLLYVLLSFIEEKISKLLEKNKKVSPLIGSLFGVIPQCGISVVASDLYLENKITLGTIFAIFFACSDEALPILFSSTNKIIYAIPLLLIKVVFGFIFGFIVDFLFRKKELDKELELDHHHGCCSHDIVNDESKLHKHLLHPLIHSLKIFLYVLIINIIFGIIIYFIGEDKISLFLTGVKWLTPFLSSLIGMIPNCASSVLISELFITSAIPFGALVSGLSINAGLGIIYLFKDKNKIKDALYIELMLLIASNFIGYITLIITEVIM